MMNLYNYRWVAGLCFVVAMGLPCQAQENDSIPVSTTDLNELVVTAKRGWIENDKIVFIPTKTEQKLSNSPETLIKSMHLPMLIVKDNTITTLAGEGVSIFINGRPASPTDLATFWPKDAKRVEYLSNPTDAKYQGAHNVINFVMQEYELGGVTKADVSGWIPNGEILTLSSKFSYKQLELGVKVYSDHLLYNRESAESHSDYKDLYYDNNFYDNISNYSSESTKQRNLAETITLSALLKLPKGDLGQTLSWKWNKEDISAHGNSGWTPMLFNSEIRSSSDDRKSNNLAYNAWYTHKFTDKWYLSSKISYAYAHTDMLSWFHTAELPEVATNAEENTHAASISVMPTWYVSTNTTFQLRCSNITTWYKTLYQGSADKKVDQTRNETAASFLYWWKPINPLVIQLTPGINILTSKIESDRISYVSPTAQATILWTANSKFNMGTTLNYIRQNPSASNTSPVTIHSSELLWTRGNPYLNPQEIWRFSIYPTYIPCNWFSLGANLSYDNSRNQEGYVYLPAPQEMGGLIRERISMQPTESYYARANLNFSAFHNTLNINLEPSYNHFLGRANGRIRINNFKYNASVDYTLQNCRFSLAYESGSKSMGNGGQTISESKGRLNFNFSWGTGYLYLDLQCYDLLRNKKDKISTFTTDSYSEHSIEYTTGRMLMLTASYTFGYGKRIDKRINIVDASSADSSILNTK